MKSEIEGLVLCAIRKACKSAFFCSNEYITKRLTNNEYHDYIKLSAVSFIEISANLDDRVNEKQARRVISALVSSKLLASKKLGKISFYWLKDINYLF